MCTGIIEQAAVAGSGKGARGWFRLDRVNVSYDHPYHAPVEHALSLDFVNTSAPPGERLAVELTAESARALAETILATLALGEAAERKAATV